MNRPRAAFSLLEALAALTILALLASTLAFLWARHLQALREAERTLEGTLRLQTAHAGLLIRGDPEWPDIETGAADWSWTAEPGEAGWTLWILAPASNATPRLTWPIRWAGHGPIPPFKEKGVGRDRD